MDLGSRKAVNTALAANSMVTTLKFIAATFSGSAPMMNEAVRSLMDRLNQELIYPIHRKFAKPADENYTFGHHQKKYPWNLYSAIGLFSIGAGLELAIAWHRVEAPDLYATFEKLVA